MVQQKMDKNRHYSVLLGGDNNNIRIKVACGSGADVSISQVLGVFVKELEEDTVNVSGGGPLLVDCSQHGQYLGLLQILQSGTRTSERGDPISLPLLLIPLHDIEFLLPLEQGGRLSTDLQPPDATVP